MLCADCVRAGPEQETVYAVAGIKSTVPFSLCDGVDTHAATEISVPKLSLAMKKRVAWCYCTWNVYGVLVFVNRGYEMDSAYEADTGRHLIDDVRYADHFGEVYVLQGKNDNWYEYNSRTRMLLHITLREQHWSVNEFDLKIVSSRQRRSIHKRYNWFIHDQQGVVFYLIDSLTQEVRTRRLLDFYTDLARPAHVKGTRIYVENHEFDINSDLKRCLMLFRCLPQEVKNRIYSFLRINII